jgi:4'-phosphopantetheinyl transferase
MEQLPTSGGPVPAAPVRVYAAHLDDIDLSTASVLIERSEVARAERTTHRDTRTTFIKSRAVLRSVLSRETGISPAKVRLRTGPYGKPELGDDDGMHFNMSHSGGITLVAVHTRPIGVDIELVDRRIDSFDGAPELLTANEWAQLSKVDRPQRTRQFFRIWTQKEALLKGMGLGISADAGSFGVAEREASEISGWHLHRLPVGPAWEGALAVRDARADVNIVDVLSLSPFKVRGSMGLRVQSSRGEREMAHLE